MVLHPIIPSRHPHTELPINHSPAMYHYSHYLPYSSGGYYHTPYHASTHTNRDRNTGPEQAAPVHGPEGFHVTLDVIHYTPSEITVKIQGNKLIVQGRHEEREDEHGHIERSFCRKYTIPQEYNPKDATTTLSSDQFLTIKVPLPNSENADERVLSIQSTGAPFQPAATTTTAPVKKE